jgi:hypothetical protein
MLTPNDILQIQSALDRYEKAFPRRPSPSPAQALKWAAGKQHKNFSGECGPLTWALETFLVWWQISGGRHWAD